MSNDLTRLPRTGIPAQRGTASDLAHEARRAVRVGSGIRGLLTRARYSGAIKLTEKQIRLLDTLAHLEDAAGHLARARLERERAIGLLNDADTVLEHDQDVRAKERLDAARALSSARTQAEIQLLKDKMELERVRAEYANLMRARSSGQSGVTYELPATPQSSPARSAQSQGQREDEADLKEALRPHALRAMVEQQIQGMIQACGGPQNLTPELKARFEEMRAAVEKFIKESGFS